MVLGVIGSWWGVQDGARWRRECWVMPNGAGLCQVAPGVIRRFQMARDGAGLCGVVRVGVEWCQMALDSEGSLGLPGGAGWHWVVPGGSEWCQRRHVVRGEAGKHQMGPVVLGSAGCRMAPGGIG